MMRRWASSVPMPVFLRLWVSEAETPRQNISTPQAMPRSSPFSFSTRPDSTARGPGCPRRGAGTVRPCRPSGAPSPGARRSPPGRCPRPDAIRPRIQASLTSVGTTCFSTWRPSRGPTSWMRIVVHGRLLQLPRDGFAHLQGGGGAAHVVGADLALGDDGGDGGLEPGAPSRFSPSQSSIILAARMVAMGLTLYWPAYLGAQPWLGSNTASFSPMLPRAAEAQAAHHLGARSLMMSPNRLVATSTP